MTYDLQLLALDCRLGDRREILRARPRSSIVVLEKETAIAAIKPGTTAASSMRAFIMRREV